MKIDGVIDARGKTLVVRSDGEVDGRVLAEFAVEAKESCGADSVLVVPSWMTLDVLDDEQMRAAGWVRA